MKKLLLLMFLFGGFVFTKVMADGGHEIPLQIIDPNVPSNGSSKAPARPLVITLEDNVLTLPALGDDFTLELRDASDAVVYTCYVPAGTTQAVLPVTLSGTYEIRLVATTYYYIGYLDL